MSKSKSRRKARPKASAKTRSSPETEQLPLQDFTEGPPTPPLDTSTQAEAPLAREHTVEHTTVKSIAESTAETAGQTIAETTASNRPDITPVVAPATESAPAAEPMSAPTAGPRTSSINPVGTTAAGTATPDTTAQPAPTPDTATQPVPQGNADPGASATPGGGGAQSGDNPAAPSDTVDMSSGNGENPPPAAPDSKVTDSTMPDGTVTGSTASASAAAPAVAENPRLEGSEEPAPAEETEEVVAAGPKVTALVSGADGCYLRLETGEQVTLSEEAWRKELSRHLTHRAPAT